MEGTDQWMNEAADKSIEEITEQISHHVPVEKGVSREQVQEMVTEVLSARASEVLSGATEAQAEITTLLREMNTQSERMSEQWASELSRRFLPKFLVNKSSCKVHAIKDAYTTACGFEFRLARDCEFKTTFKEDSQCEAAGCVKLFNAWQ